MESANDAPAAAQAWPAAGGAAAALIRPAYPGDQAAILALCDSALNVHFHADWQDLAAWIGRPGTVVEVRDGRVRGYLAATLDPPPVAWLRVVALDRLDPADSFRALCAQAIAALRPAGATQLACLSARAWSDRVLRLCGFAQTHALEELVRAELPPPIVARGALTLRPARASDYAAIAELDARAFGDPLWWHSAQQLARAAPHAVAFDVALAADTLVGYQYSVRAAERQGHIVRIAVDPQRRGDGIGSALIAQALQTLWQRGLRRVSLNMQASNDPARRLYERFDFETTGTRFPVFTLTL